MGGFPELQRYFGGTHHDVSTWERKPIPIKKTKSQIAKEKREQNKRNYEEEFSKLEKIKSFASDGVKRFETMLSTLASSEFEEQFEDKTVHKEFLKWKKEFFKTFK